MAEVKWTPQAVDDLESITAFIAKDSPYYARLFALDAFEAVERLFQFPKSGRVVPELRNPLIREVILGNYRIVYRLKGNRVEMLMIHHGAKFFPSAR